MTKKCIGETKIMKKLLLFGMASSLLGSGASWAGNTASNFNMGLYGGYIASSSKLDRTLTGGVNKSSADLGGNGGTIGLNLAYDYVTGNKGVWGIDLFGAITGQTAEVTFKDMVQNAVFTSKMKYSLGTAFKLGYMVDRTFAFFRIGYINTRFNLRSENKLLASPNDVSSKKKNASGLLLGLGVDFPMGEKFTYGFAYDFAVYQNIKLSHIATADHTVKPRMHFLNVVFKYKI